MNWNRLYGLKSYLRSSLWVVPFIAIPFELIATRLLHWLDAWPGWPFLGFGVPGAQALLEAIVTATLSFVVFTFGSLLVAIQVASAQLTPRIIATTLLRNDVVKYTVGLFIFTLLFALSARSRIENDVNQLVMLVTAILGLCSFGAFFFLIDYASRLLRPVSDVPFDFERRRVSVLAERDGARILIVKGAPEAIIDRSVALEAPDGSLRPLDPVAKT